MLFILTLLRFYKKYISGLLPPSCRFYPTCSNYMSESVEIHGNFKGTLMGIMRLLRCNPFFSGGYDPVPERKGMAHFKKGDLIV